MPTKLVFYYVSPKGHPELFYRQSKALGEGDIDRYNLYMAQVLTGLACPIESCEVFLNNINDVENGRKCRVETGENDIVLDINNNYIQVSILSFDEWSNQPEGRFTLDEWKKALLGWKQFLSMPESLASELIVEL